MPKRDGARGGEAPDVSGQLFFQGTRTQQYWQVANAVPPLLARKIAQLIYNFKAAARAVR